MEDLRRMRGVAAKFITEPPYCYPCALAFIQPSQVNAPDGVWRKEAIQAFDDLTDGIELEANVSNF